MSAALGVFEGEGEQEQEEEERRGLHKSTKFSQEAPSIKRSFRSPQDFKRVSDCNDRKLITESNWMFLAFFCQETSTRERQSVLYTEKLESLASK